MAKRFSPKINLKKFFTKEARDNIIGKSTSNFSTYKSLIEKRKGIRGDNAPRNKPSTIARKGKNHWLKHTGETQQKGFLFRANKHDLTVYANKSSHSGKSYYMTKTGKKTHKQKNPPTYEQIFKWHNKRRYSGVFGRLPIGSKFPDRLVKAVGKQLHPQIVRYLKSTLRRS